MGPRDLLRSATAELHGRLDARFRALDLTVKADYLRFLAAQAAAVVPIEHALELAGVAKLVPDWDRRSRRAAILADLAILGQAMIPTETPAPAVTSPAGIFGTLYVLEGSRLGGEVLLRRMLATAGPELCAATRFLSHGRGERLWGSFLAMLAKRPVGENGQLVRAAAGAFALFDAAARRPPPASTG